MTAELHIKTIKCTKASNSVNCAAIKLVTSAIEEVGEGIGKVFSASSTISLLLHTKSETVEAAIAEAEKFLEEIPEFAQKAGAAAGYPDQLYLSTSNTPGQDKIWPEDHKYEEINDGQLAIPALTIPFDEIYDVNLWEKDVITADDFLGRLTVEESQASEHWQTKILTNEKEGSTYVVVFRVTSKTDAPTAT